MAAQSFPLPVGIVDAGAKAQSAAFVAFLEGPAADAEGNVFFSDIKNNRVMRLAPDGTLDVFREPSGRTNGNVFDREGRLISCEGAEFGPNGGRRIVRADTKTGEVTVLTDRYEGRRYNSPNDAVVDSQGRIYFTDPLYDERFCEPEMDVYAVYRIDPDRSVTRVLAQPDIEKPNGLALSPDERTLYLIDTNSAPGGNRKVWAFTIGSDDRLTNRRLVYDFAPGRGGDGMEVDVEGNLYVCAGILTPRGPQETDVYPTGVYVIRPGGELVGRIPIPEDAITNCCFGGPDLRMLNIVAGRNLYQVPVKIAGFHQYPKVR